MRPVNLIPPEERRGGTDGRTKGSGAISYAIVAVLAIAVAAIAATTYYGNQVNERKSEISALESQVASTTARAQSLQQFTSFQALRDARVATIDSLARTRFNWQRVLRELARIIPEDVEVTNVTGTANPAVAVPDEAGISLRDTVPGPALEIVGCALGQRNVARFIASLHDIDGVTRVTAEQGIRSDDAPLEDSADGAVDSSGTCVSRGDSIFQIVVAFDSLPVPEGAVPPPVDGTAVPATTEATGESVVPEASAQQAESQAQIDNAEAEAADATNLNPAG
jgi:Tfp pilus assembly protein PilN